MKYGLLGNLCTNKRSIQQCDRHSKGVTTLSKR